MKAKSLKSSRLLALVAAAGLSVLGSLAQAADTIKVGVLHSLSGTMAISETTLKDTMLMLIAEQNKKGGLLGKTARGRWWSTRPPTGRCSPRKPAN